MNQRIQQVAAAHYYSHTTDMKINEPSSHWAKWNGGSFKFKTSFGLSVNLALGLWTLYMLAIGVASFATGIQSDITVLCDRPVSNA